MKKGKDNGGGVSAEKNQQGNPSNDELSMGDQLLARLLKIKVPIVPDPAPAKSPTSNTGATQSALNDVEDRMVKDRPGLTREEAPERRERVLRKLGMTHSCLCTTAYSAAV
jgi:hypothetical protein